MVPESIQNYLRDESVPFLRYWHPRAVSAQHLASALHVTGHRVAKSVIVRADAQLWICLIPAAEVLDLEKVQDVLGVHEAMLASEGEFAARFPQCEVGAEPPFGRLYGLPVLVDESLSVAEDLLLRAGSHEEALEVSVKDFIALESPRMAGIIRERLDAPLESHAMHP